MNTELLMALDMLEKEKGISKELLVDAIENSLVKAYSKHYNAENAIAHFDLETGDFHIYSQKTVVENVENPVTDISLDAAKEINPDAELGQVLNIEVKSKDFGRVATLQGKQAIIQRLREEEKKGVYDYYIEKKDDIVTGIVQRITGKRISVTIGKADTILMEKDQTPGEFFRPTERIKLYIEDVINDTKNIKIIVSRRHEGLVKRLFEQEVTEIQEGVVEIKSIAREAGSRTKMAVLSNDENVDAVGACVGINGARVNAVVDELRNEKIDIVNWSDNPAILIENALSPSKVVSVLADPDNKEALVIVPDYQLSLAIGKEGQNARLAAKLTSYKIDIKSESQAKEEGIQYVFNEEDYYDGEYYDGEYDDEYYDDEYYDGEYDTEYDEEYDGESEDAE